MTLWLLLTLYGCDPAPRCEGRDCYEQGAVASSGVEALVLLDEGCTQQVWEACGEAARIREFGDRVTVDHAGAFSGYQHLCDADQQSGCMAMANMLRKGIAPGGADPARARLLLEGACTPANPTACIELASWRIHHGDAGAQRTSVAMLERLCEQDVQAACVELGFCASRGMGMAVDPGRAAALYRSACPSEPGGCFNLALLYKDGRGVPQDLAASLELLEHACDAGMAEGCLMAGNQLLEQGETALADTRFERACSEGLPLGCVNLAVGLLDPVSGEPDPTRALPMLQRACDAGEPYGCANLGRELVQGRYCERDLEGGQALMLRACELGVDAACQELGLR